MDAPAACDATVLNNPGQQVCIAFVCARHFGYIGAGQDLKASFGSNEGVKVAQRILLARAEPRAVAARRGQRAHVRSSTGPPESSVRLANLLLVHVMYSSTCMVVHSTVYL